MTRAPFFPSPLYAIVDPLGRANVDLVALGEHMLAGGARLLQLRWKDAPTGALLSCARELLARCRARGARLVINDRVDVAALCDADGVHLGQEDLPVADARRLLGGAKWIGLSTHALEQAVAAAAEDIDYLGFGPIFATATKVTGYDPRGLEALAAVRAQVPRPIVAIGGITPRTAPAVLAAGADAVAMIGAIAGAADPEASVRRCLATLAGATGALRDC